MGGEPSGNMVAVALATDVQVSAGRCCLGVISLGSELILIPSYLPFSYKEKIKGVGGEADGEKGMGANPDANNRRVPFHKKGCLGN